MQSPAFNPTAAFVDFLKRRAHKLAVWLSFGCVLWITGGHAQSSPSPTGKVVRQYALTSANDFPQRDPQDWRLLASNDGGKTWVTLDTRKSESFGQRHERRVFPIANEAAFEWYRLQVDRVRECSAANSVQLAELELFGDTAGQVNLTPTFTDQVTAQGDNPPTETIARLFDGRAETKWLDRPTNRLTCASWAQWRYRAASGIVLTNVSQLLALRTRASDGYSVRLEAVVVGQTPGSKRLFVLDATGLVELSDAGAAAEISPGQRVTIEGLTKLADNRVVIGDARVQQMGALPATAPERIALEQPLNVNDEFRWVEIEGAIQFRHPSSTGVDFDVKDGDHTMRVRWIGDQATAQLPGSGTRIVVRGICQGGFNEESRWVTAQLWAVGADALSSTGTAGHGERDNKLRTVNGGNAGTVLAKIEHIRRLSQEQLNQRPGVKIRGVVTHLLGGFMQDDTGGIQVAFPPDASRQLTESGLFVEVEGWGGLSDVGNPVVSADRIRILGKGKLPQPQTLSLSQVMNGQLDAQWIEMEGVVRATDGAHLLMICYGREVMASISEAAASEVSALVDASVRVRGVGVTALDDQSRVQGIHLLIPSLEHLDVLSPPADPHTLPVQPIGSLLGLSGARMNAHRVKVEGVVTLHENQKLFLRDDTGAAMAIFKEDVVLDPRFGRSRWLFWRTARTNSTYKADVTYAPGDRVQVIGFPETRNYSPVLTETTVKKISSGNPVPLYQATANGVNDGRADSQLVVVEGLLLGLNTIGQQVVMALEWNDRTLQVLLPVKEAMTVVPGSRLRVTGVCQVDSTPYAQLGLRVTAVRILTRSAADIVVLSRPSWWTVKRALTVMGGMAFVILAALIWIKQLRKQVEERSKQLAAEIQLREQTERRSALEQERARIAKDLHDDLGANLAQIVFLSQRVDGGRHDLEQVDRWFRLIPTTARRTIQSLDEIVWAINPRHDLAESLANYLSQFAQEHLTLAGVRCILDVPTVLPEIRVSAEVRHNLVLAAREAINNVATHAAATEARVSLVLDDLALIVAVADNGRGFDPATPGSSGNGLSNMRRRLEDVGGRLELESSPSKGTIVRFVVPRRQLHGRVIGGAGSASAL